MRYFRQRDNYSCAPIAIGNALKVKGNISSVSSIEKRLRKECKTNKKRGTKFTYIMKAVDKYFPKSKFMNGISPRELKKHLNNGGIGILREQTTKRRGHVYLCVGKSSKYYEVVNYYKGKTSSFVKIEVLDKRLKGNKNNFGFLI